MSSLIYRVTVGTCVLLFVLVVSVLQSTQVDYDAQAQFISELALGRGGEWLRLAFVALATALAVVANGLRPSPAPRWLIALLFAAAVCFVTAGGITLEVSADAHIALVAIAFICCGTAMYALSRSKSVIRRRFIRILSSSCTVTLCGAVGLGSQWIDGGLAQRLAASALLCWLGLIAWQVDTAQPSAPEKPPQPSAPEKPPQSGPPVADANHQN